MYSADEIRRRAALRDRGVLGGVLRAEQEIELDVAQLVADLVDLFGEERGAVVGDRRAGEERLQRLGRAVAGLEREVVHGLVLVRLGQPFASV